MQFVAAQWNSARDLIDLPEVRLGVDWLGIRPPGLALFSCAASAASWSDGRPLCAGDPGQEAPHQGPGEAPDLRLPRLSEDEELEKSARMLLP